MRRNPLLYSNPSEIEQIPAPTATPPKEASGKSSFFFYFIILANSLLVLFVLGFIWFLFLKSPDLQIKEISDRLFGTSAPIEQAPQTIVAPKIQTEVIISPTQQEKDEIQQAKLKQMREREELAAERVRLEAIKAEIEKEKIRASEAQQAIGSLQKQKNATNNTKPITKPSNGEKIDTTDVAVEGMEEQSVEIEQTRVEDISTKLPDAPKTADSASKEPATNSTSSQVDLIMEALKNQQQKPAGTN